MSLVLDVVLAGACVFSIGLQKAYASVPPQELKRRARKGDNVARLLYRAASYGSSLRVVLWSLIVATSTVFFLVMSRSTSTVWSLIISGGLIWLAFVWLPSTKVTKFSSRIAAYLAPVFAWLLNFLHPVINKLVVIVRNYRPVHSHTGVYEKQDLLALLKHQASQADNRIDKVELDIARHALQFGDKLIRDVMLPRRAVKMVAAIDSTGPLVIDELHKSGHSRFPVFEGKKDNVVGILHLRDLIDLHKEGTIGSLMHKHVAYVHEDKPLNDALQASLKTHQQMLIVVNEFEEFVGVITMEDVLEQVIGKPIVDEFDQYEDLRAVVAREAKDDHEDHQESDKITAQVASKIIKPSPTDNKDDKIALSEKTE